MTQIAAQQLDSIHSMLHAGNRNLRLERHSLILWGLTGGALCLFSDSILTRDQFPQLLLQALAWLLLLTIVFGGVGIVDWHLTRIAKQERDEALSFIHRQVLKVWWLLIGVGVLVTFGSFFFGGGNMLFSAWLVLLGIGLYVHGLFSEELLEWIGALMILIAILCMGFQLPFESRKWIAASIFGIGLPALALMLDRGRSLAIWKRMLQSLLWALAVLALPLAAQRYEAVYVLPENPVISLSTFLQQNDTSGIRIVSLPAGTTIPVEIEVSGDVFDGTSKPIFPLTLKAPIEVMMKDGQPSGESRAPGGNWLHNRDSHWVNIPWIRSEFVPGNGPIICSSLIVNFKHR